MRLQEFTVLIFKKTCRFFLFEASQRGGGDVAQPIGEELGGGGSTRKKRCKLLVELRFCALQLQLFLDSTDQKQIYAATQKQYPKINTIFDPA